ncbi:MAG TPA: ribonuclease P protein component [Taishania sp.]|nr:ribonuclease P protein component [Taishania sp.]
MNEQFGKEYKLCSKKLINSLFENGRKVSSFPFAATYKLTELPNDKVPFQVVISVPKRIYKHAHDRNRIKRLIRECLRKNKSILENFLNNLPNNNRQLALFLVYRHNEELDYETLMNKMSKFLLTLTTAIEKHEESKK